VETRYLPCILTEKELLERGQRAAELVSEIASQEEEKKAAAAAAKSKIDALEAQLRDVSREVRTKVERRQVEVRLEKDFDRNVEETVRCDTGEVVETRVLMPQERQTLIPVPDELLGGGK